MISPLQIAFAGGASAHAIEITDPADIAPGVAALGLGAPRPTLVIVGGAGGLDEVDLSRLSPLFVNGIAPVVERHRAAVVDGGTQSGVMRLCGETRAALFASFPLIGVAAIGTVRWPGRSPASDDAADLEPNHSHFVLVPGADWGAESGWIAQITSAIAAGSPSVTVLINGGRIAIDDVERSIEAGRRVVAVAGSGRTADAFADALHGAGSDDRIQTLAASALVSSVPIDDPSALSAALEGVLAGTPS